MPNNGNEIVHHLPYLRRYARALCGSQERGDKYVRVCLETLLTEPEQLKAGDPPRVALFQLFHEVWARIGEKLNNGEAVQSPSGDRLESQILKLPQHERCVLLLTVVERFAIAETAAILGITTATAELLLQRARADLSDQAATTVLIIEDEPVIAFDIAGIVSEMGHKVVGTATTKDEAVAVAKAKRPGIVLADIQLSDGSSGIDAAAEILGTMDVPVIFITAYPERLLTGERTEPTYLVTKPFEPDVLKVTIYQALFSHGTPSSLRAAG